MAKSSDVQDKSFQDSAPKVTADKQTTVASTAPKAETTTKSNDKVDKSFQDDKKKVNKNIKVGDRVAYPYREGEHGKRVSKVYEVDDDTVTILAHDGQKTTVALERVELV